MSRRKKEHIPPLQRDRIQKAVTANKKQTREFTGEKSSVTALRSKAQTAETIC